MGESSELCVESIRVCRRWFEQNNNINMKKEWLNPSYVFGRRDRILPVVHRAINRIGIPVTGNDFRLAALKNRHKGQRCFVIGNGPSLSTTDLDQLRGEVTFACNKIYLAFNETDWRPTYYAVEDPLVAQQNYEEINNLYGFTKLFPNCMKQWAPLFRDAIYFELLWS
ncbi:hypothetical protein ACFLV7_16775 [Chloroflexota bacterium]